MGAELVHRAADAFLRRVLVAAQRDADGAEVAALEIAQHDGRAFPVVQSVDRLVEVRGDFFKSAFGVVLPSIHFTSLPFPVQTTPLVAHDGRGDMEGAPVQPAAEHDLLGKCSREPRQIGENHLRDVLGTVRIAIHQPQRRRINQINVARDQFAKGVFGSVRNVIRK